MDMSRGSCSNAVGCSRIRRQPFLPHPLPLFLSKKRNRKKKTPSPSHPRKPSAPDPPPTPRLPHRRRHPDPSPRLPHRRSTDALATPAPPSSAFGCVWLIAEAEPRRRRCFFALLRFAGGRESRPTFPLLASASASVASPPPAGEPPASSCPSPPLPRVFVLHQPDLTSISSPRSVVRRSRSHRRPIAPPLRRARRLPRRGIRRSSRFRTSAGAGEKRAPPPPSPSPTPAAAQSPACC